MHQKRVNALSKTFSIPLSPSLSGLPEGCCTRFLQLWLKTEPLLRQKAEEKAICAFNKVSTRNRERRRKEHKLAEIPPLPVFFSTCYVVKPSVWRILSKFFPFWKYKHTREKLMKARRRLEHNFKLSVDCFLGRSDVCGPKPRFAFPPHTHVAMLSGRYIKPKQRIGQSSQVNHLRDFQG